MQALNKFKEELKAVWTPVIAVLASQEADDVCRSACGFGLVQLLRQFGNIQKMNAGLGVPIRTPAEQPIRLYDWQLRFHTPEEMVHPTPEDFNLHLTDFLKSTAQLEADTPCVSKLLAQKSLDEAAPWFAAYFSEFMRLFKFGIHETMDHPVACLLILPSSFNGEFTAAFAELFEARTPPLLKQLVRDGHAIMQHVILHDKRSATAEQDLTRARNAVKGMSSSSTSNHVLIIGDGEVTFESQAQRSLSPQDSVAVAMFTEEFAVRRVAPHIESRIRMLDQTVLSARRGLRNQLKTLLFRKSLPSPSSAGPSTSGHISSSPRTASSLHALSVGASYALDSLEMQLRQLSDLALMIGDCETSLVTLRLLAADWKADKANFHYAGAQEAIAAAIIMSAGTFSDVTASLKEAFSCYNQVAQQFHAVYRDNAVPPSATSYATRAAFWLASYLTAAGRYMEASIINVKAHLQEENIRAALLMERAAHLLLYVKPPRVRKFAFHMVLSGLRYTKGGAQDLAARAYSFALDVYKGSRWEVAEEHVREALGKGCIDAGDFAQAMQHFAAILACSSQLSASLQRHHITQYAEAETAAAAQLGFLPQVDVALPEINTSRLALLSSGQASYANVEARQTPARVWTALESWVIPSSDVNTNWMNGSSRGNLVVAGLEHCCCVGEDVGMDIELRNPLKIELNVTKLRLSCTFQASAKSDSAIQEEEAQEQDGGALHQHGSGNPVQLREERISLHPGERAVVHLRLRPLRAGVVHVTGVSWELNGIIKGHKLFAAEQGNDCAERAMPQEPEKRSSSGIALKVLPPMPRLELLLEGFPQMARVGELVKCSMKLKNSGAMTLHALKAAIDSDWVYLSWKDDQEALQRQGGVVFPGGATKLAVNEVIVVDVYLRPIGPGSLTINMCWYYEPLIKLETLPYRTLRATFTLSVLPSLELHGRILPSLDAGVQLLVLDALNLQGLDTFHLMECALPHTGWSLNLIQDGDSPVSTTVPLQLTLGPEAAVAIHTRIRPSLLSESAVKWTSEAEEYLSHLVSTSNNNSKYPPQAVLRWQVTGVGGDQTTAVGFTVIDIASVSRAPAVQARLVGPFSVEHDFEKNPVCQVETFLEVSNSLQFPLDVRWGAFDLGTPQPRPGAFQWWGLTQGIVPSLLPGHTEQIPIRLAVHGGGWIKLDSCWVAWTCKEAAQMSGSAAVDPLLLYAGSAPP